LIAASPETLTAGSAGARRDDRVGIFGAHKRAEALRQENSHLAGARDALAAENEQLRQQVTGLLGMSIDELAAEAGRVRAQVQANVEQARADLDNTNRQAAEARKVRDGAMAEAEAALHQLRTVRAQVVATDEVAALQEVGIYEYRHPLQDAVAYKSRRRASSARRRRRLGKGDDHGRAGGHTARMTSAGLAPDSSASALMSSGSDVQMTAPVAAAITTTVASTTSEVPARPQRIPAALEVSSPT